MSLRRRWALAGIATLLACEPAPSAPEPSVDAGRDTGVARPDGDVDAGCPATSLCGSRCVDLTRDDANCGACDRVCTAGQTCRAGTCECSVSGQVACDGSCVSTLSDPLHCGGCGRACPAELLCQRGECACERAGETVCDGACVLLDSPAHCGACENACRSGELCAAGRCECASGLVCDGACIPASDTRHCGACGTVCRADQVCSAGGCTCAGLAWDCGDACVPVDDANCGGCGVSCGGGQTCVTATRTCACSAPGASYCAGADACVDLASDPRHCGTCDNVCSGTATCAGGRCTCPSGTIYCDGAGCVDSSTDALHCGGCGRVCAAPRSCRGGGCSCASAATYCMGTDSCTDLRTDVLNCGACDRACTGGRMCTSATCQCPAPTRGTPVRLDSSALDVRSVALASGPGGAAVMWTDEWVDTDVWFQRLGPDGAPLAPAVSLARPTGASIANRRVAMAFDGSEWGVAWTTGRTYFQRLAPDGTPRMAVRDLSPDCGFTPAVLRSSVLGWVVACAESASIGDVRLLFLGPTGESTAPSLRVSRVARLMGSAIAPDGSMLIAYWDGPAHVQRVEPDGSMLTAPIDIGSVEVSSIVWDGSTFLAAVRRHPTSTSYEVWAYRGARLEDRLLLRSSAGFASLPSVAVLGESAQVSFVHSPAASAMGDLWTTRLSLPASGSPAVLTPAARHGATTTFQPEPRASVVFIDDDRIMHAWADSRGSTLDPYVMTSTLGMCR